MTDRVRQDEINDILWGACDKFRGALSSADYKDYILVMLFLKYLSDLWKDKRQAYEARYKGDAERVSRAMARERFVVPPESDFDFLYSRRDKDNLGELINIALANIEQENRAKLENVFRNVDFNSEPILGETKDRNRRLKGLLELFADERLDLRPSRVGNVDVIGNAYMYLIGKFASGAGKKGGEFYTPEEVSRLLAKLVRPKPGDRICDPACGSGSLLICVAKEVGSGNYSLFGQEANGETWALCRMNMFLHDMDSARIEWGDTLTSPKLIEADRLMKFNVVVANPPFSLKEWGAEGAVKDKFNRFHRGVPPKSKGDYAFISHMVEAALEGEGKVGVIVPHGVLFRAASEGVIRRKLIEENLLEAVIGLPANLFFGTTIPAAILLFNKGKASTDVLFIDASKEFDGDKTQNRLRDEDIRKIVEHFEGKKQTPSYSHLAKLEEIAQNDFNLNLSRYVDTFKEEDQIDIGKVQREIIALEAELTTTRSQMARYMKELGLDD
jgi:type I restriction enzyme M protein